MLDGWLRIMSTVTSPSTPAVRVGSIRGLAQCASERGTFTILALDHRQNLRKALNADDPQSVSYAEMASFKRAVIGGLASAATGVLLDPETGVADSILDGTLPATVGLVVALEQTGYEGPPTARRSRLLPGWTAAKVKRMGAAAAKLLIYYHPQANTADGQEQLLARVAQECRALDIALFLEPLSFSLTSAPDGEERRTVVVETARRLTRIGGDILKAEFPCDPTDTDEVRWREACEELTAASAVPWVLLSGGVDAPAFEAQAATACRAGASGVLAGRAIWAEAVGLPPDERDDFLATIARQRLARLAAICERWARPWRAGVPLASAGEGWYRDYGT